MQFLLMIYGNEAGMASATPSDAQQMMAAYAVYTTAMREAGVLIGGERLRPSKDAASVRVTADKTEILNGPYAETREQLGGYYLIEVADQEAALAWAARCPGAHHGTIEVRPIWAM